MTFAIPATAYDRFMGRYSQQLAPLFADFAGVAPDGAASPAPVPPRVLDVGCGPGALTAELVRRLGAGAVAAAEPAGQFAAACAERHPGADVRQAPAEQLPWEDGAFGAALGQLVVSFFADAPAGLREMRRVTAPGGTVALAMWGSRELEVAEVVWEAAQAVEPGAEAPDRALRFRSEPELLDLAEDAGLAGVETARLRVTAGYGGFDEWWESVRTGAGPVGALCARLEPERLAALRQESYRLLGEPDGPFQLAATAWAVRGSA